MRRLAGVLLLAFPIVTAAQQPTIEIQKLWTMVDRDGRSFSGPPDDIAALSGGRFALVEAAEPRLPVVIDSTGRFIRALGRRGQGPGEFPNYSGPFGVGAGDTLFVANNGMISVFDRELRFVRTFRPEPGGVGHFTLVPQGFAVVARAPAPDDGSVPYHILAHDGKTLRSFGYEPRSRDLFKFLLAPSKNGIWANKYTTHRLERWGDGSTPDVVIEVLPSWFRVLPRDRYAPFSHVRSMREVNGHLWVMSRNPVPNIDEVVRQATGNRSAVREGGGPPLPMERMHTTALEVYDAANGKLIAEKTLPALAVRFIDDDRFVIYSVNVDGLPQLEVWRMSLRR